MQTWVLIVDDSPELRKLFSFALSGYGGYTIRQAPGGAEALDLIAQNTFDVAVLDLGMPDMNGIDLINRLRQGERTADMAIVVASGREDGAEAALAAGADRYLQKPVQPQELYEAIEAVLAEKRGSRRVGGDTLGTQTLLESFPYFVTVFDDRRRVVMANTAFFEGTSTGLADSGVNGMEAVSELIGPLDQAIRTHDVVEETTGEGTTRTLVSVYPIGTTTSEGNRLYLHIARPMPEC